MRVASVDQGFVGASPRSVYGLLAEPSGYGTWWPGTSEGIRLGGRRPLRARADGHRPELGVTLHVEGDLTGTLEWYLEAFEEGTIINAILNLEVPGGARRSERRLLRARADLRRAIVGLKEALEPR